MHRTEDLIRHRTKLNLAFDFKSAKGPVERLSMDDCDMDFENSVTGLSEEDKAAIVQYISTKVHKEIQEHEIRAIVWQLIAVLSIFMVFCLARFAQVCN